MQLTSPQVNVFKCDKFGQPTDLNGNVVGSFASAAPFDQTTFGDYICVQITGTYQPVLPSFMWLAPSITVTSNVVMCSEGN